MCGRMCNTCNKFIEEVRGVAGVLVSFMLRPTLTALLLTCAAAPFPTLRPRLPPAPPPKRVLPELSAKSCRLLYMVSCVTPAISVAVNRYTGLERSELLTPARPTDRVYRTLFYFARLKPRLVFSIGACLRALQLTTPVGFVFDPSAGVGLGLNMLAIFCNSRWPAPLVLGWAASRSLWESLGAKPPSGVTSVPIRVSM